MPEGVEVKLSADLIRPLVQGRLLIQTEIGENSRYANKNPEGFDEFQEYYRSERCYDVGGCTILDVQTKGKFMYWSFREHWYMFCTFGMTGQWSPEKGKHPCFTFLHTYNQSTSSLLGTTFNDPRHFGTIKFVKGIDNLQNKLDELGWDPLAKEMSGLEPVIKALGRTNKPIAQMLMDQGVFAGVGNYIRAEALYQVKLSPWHPSNTLTMNQILSLCQAIVDVMKESYAHQGATILTYKNAFGAEGKYSSCFKVYGKKADPDGNPIIKQDTPDKRTIHWCPAIQT